MRAVNHRRLEIVLRLPELVRFLEPVVRQRINAHIKRGRIECTVRCESAPGAGGAIVLNEPLLSQILDGCEKICARGKHLGLHIALNPIDVLRWPGVLEMEAVTAEQLEPAINELVDGTLEGIQAVRSREGEALRILIAERCRTAREILSALQKNLPGLMDGHRRQLLARARELSTELDSDRLAQEVLILAQKHDIREELDRLDIHLNEVGEIMERQEPAGRRLDFMMQEMHREANTLGAKSAHADTTAASLELRLLIEQMREQVQNVE